uniref:Tyr recombinase domain-containing protein n=1 Tax=Xenopus tropicalis TaxID=8364 RepID=A0A803JZG3_XENTR
MDCLSEIQDGVSALSNPSNGTGGIFDISGHEGCVPSCSHIPSSSSISSICLPGSTPSVHRLTLRALIGSPNFHKDHVYNGSPPPSPRSVYHSIFGRSFDKGSIEPSGGEGPNTNHADPTRIWMDDQQTKIIPDSVSENALSGVHIRHPSGEGTPTRREGTKTHITGSGTKDNSKTIDSPLHEGTGRDGIVDRGCSIRTVSYQVTSTMHNIRVEEAQVLVPQNRPQCHNKEFTGVVDNTSKPFSGTVAGGTKVAGDNDGRQLIGLGSNLQDSDCPGTMVRIGRDTPDKYTGNQGDFQSSGSLGGSTSGPRCKNPVGQCYGGSISEPARRDKERCSSKRDKQDISMGRDKGNPDLSSSHSRSGKLGSGLSKSALRGSHRMGTEHRGLQLHHDKVGSTRPRPHGIAPQPQDRQIHSKGKGPASRGRGCDDSRMGVLSSICIPTNSDVTSHSKENKTRRGYFHCHSTALAKEVVVHTSNESISRISHKITTTTRSSESGSHTTPQSRNVQFDGVEIEKLIWTTKGFSSDVAQTMLEARKKVSSKAYHRIWKLFMEWCVDRDIFYQRAKIPTVLQFLQEGLQKGLSLGTLKVQVSALSVLLQSRLALQEDVRTFLQGVAHIVPPVKSPVPPWDLNVVLSALINSPFEPLSIVELRWLTWKVVFLMAISSARRISELSALSCESPYLIFHEEKAVLRTVPSFLPKVVSPFHLNEEIVIPSFCSSPKNDKETKLHNLDVVRALHTYVDRTAHFRKSKCLFVIPSGSRKGLPASKATIARWIKESIRQAYISLNESPPFQITAHSTRAVSASWACRNMASAEQLCKAATWSSAHTFTKFYRFDTFASAQAAFGRKVLQAVVS